MLIDSIDVGREFCKFMTTTTLGAIPTYLALLKFVLPNNYSLQSYDEVVFLIPPMSFLTSSRLSKVATRNASLQRQNRQGSARLIMFCSRIFMWTMRAALHNLRREYRLGRLLIMARTARARMGQPFRHGRVINSFSRQENINASR